MLAGLITTIGQFLRVSELLEGHRAATIAYSKFSRNIAVELSLPREERNVDGSEFINNSRSELDRLIEQSPNIPMDILHKFGKKFDNDGFTKPDILKITPVDIYIDDEKEKLEKVNVLLSYIAIFTSIWVIKTVCICNKQVLNYLALAH